MAKIANLTIEIANKADDVEQSINNIITALQRMEKVKANLSFKGIQTGGLEKVYRYVNQLNRILTPLAHTLGTVKEGFDALGANMSAAMGISKKEAEGLKTVLSSLKEVNAPKVDTPAKEVTKNMADVGQKAKEATGGVNIFKASLSGMSSAFKGALGFAGKLKNLFSKIGNTTKSITKPLQGIGGAIRNLTKQLPFANKGFGGLIKQFGRLFKLKVMRQVVMQVMQGFKEGIGNLYEYSRALGSIDSSNFKNTMDGFSTALQYMKNSVAAAVAPLLQSLLPAFQAITNWIVAACNALNQFISLLQGKTTFTRAKNAMKEYSEATGGAAEKAEDLIRTLMGFDEINKLNEAASGGGGGGASAPDYSDMFEEAAIGDMLSADLMNFFEEIKKAIAAGDWEQVGSLLAQGLNKITSALDDWNKNKFRPKALEIAKNVTDLLNGLFRGWDADAAGRTLAGLIDTVLRAITTAINNFDWATAGQRLGEFLNGLFGDKDIATRAGKMLGDLFNGIFDGALALLEQDIGGTLGARLADFLNALFDKTKNGKLGETLASLINNVTSFFAELFGGLNWELLGETLGNNIISLIDNIKWENITEALRSFFDGVLTTAMTLNEMGVGGKLGEGAANLLNALFDSAKNGNIGAIFGETVNLVTDFFTRLFTDTDWKSIGETISINIRTAFEHIDWEAIKEMVKAGVNAVIDLASGLLSDFLDGDAKKSLENIKEDLSKIIDHCGNIAAKLKELWESPVVQSLVSEVLYNTILSIEGGLSLVADALDVIAAILDGDLTGAIEKIGEMFLGVTEVMQKTIKNIGDIIIEVITGAGNIYIDFMDNVVTPIHNQIVEYITKQGDLFIDHAAGVIETFTPVYNWFVETFGKIAEFFGIKYEKIETDGKGVAEALKKKWHETMEGYQTDTSEMGTVWESITGNMKDDWDGTMGSMIGRTEDYKDVWHEIMDGNWEKAAQIMRDVERDYGVFIADIKADPVEFKGDISEVTESIEDILTKNRTMNGEIQFNPIPFNGDNSNAIQSINDVEWTFNSVHDFIGWSPINVYVDTSAAESALWSLYGWNGTTISFNAVARTSNIPALYASGGVPDYGSMFIAGEPGAGTELVGNINGRTGVASQGEITGIADAVYTSSDRESKLLAEQNEILREIASKDNSQSISVSSVLNAMDRANRRTGKSLVAMG